MPIKDSQASARIGEFARYGFLKRSTASTGSRLSRSCFLRAPNSEGEGH
jgi:hypothetical protein